MPIPAILWSLAARAWHLVSGQSARGDGAASSRACRRLPSSKRFHADWFVAAIGMHAILSLAFGLAFALVLPRLPAIPGPMAWGGLLLPLLWTAMSYGLMGVVNPVLQERVDWPWFIVSQFVFGIVAAIVVVRIGASLHSAGRQRSRSPARISSPIEVRRRRP